MDDIKEYVNYTAILWCTYGILIDDTWTLGYDV